MESGPYGGRSNSKVKLNIVIYRETFILKS